MRTLITAVFAAMLVAPAQARTPDKVEVDDFSAARIENETPWQWPDPNPAIGATKPWLILVTFFYRNEKPLLGGGDRFASREDCEAARRRLGFQVFADTQNTSKKPIGMVVNCVFAPH